MTLLKALAFLSCSLQAINGMLLIIGIEKITTKSDTASVKTIAMIVRDIPMSPPMISIHLLGFIAWIVCLWVLL